MCQKVAQFIFQVSVTSPTSQLIFQLFRRFTYVIAHSPTLPLLHLRHSSFSNLSFASPTSKALHLRHLASRPWCVNFLQTWFTCQSQARLRSTGKVKQLSAVKTIELNKAGVSIMQLTMLLTLSCQQCQ